MKMLSTEVVCALGLLSLAGGVQGDSVDLMPSGATGLGGTTVAAEPFLAGTTNAMVDVLLPFQIFDEPNGILLTGNLQNRIVRSDETGLLHFYYRLRDMELIDPRGISPTQAGINRVETNGFAGWETLVEWRIDGLPNEGGVGPSRATRSADGDLLTYLFGNLLLAPEESKFFYAATDAPAYTMSTTTLYLNSGASFTFETFAPAVPAPAGGAMVASLGLIAMRRRR